MNFWLWVLLGFAAVAGYGMVIDLRRRRRHDTSGDPSSAFRRAQARDESRGAVRGGAD